jgi:hypothetical protein
MSKRERFNHNWRTVRNPQLGKDVELDKPSIYRKKSISQSLSDAMIEYYKTEQEKREPARY